MEVCVPPAIASDNCVFNPPWAQTQRRQTRGFLRSGYITIGLDLARTLGSLELISSRGRPARRLTGENPQNPRPRIQGLSDLIFGLALSIGAIQLVGSLPQDQTTLATDLLAFGFSFLILMNVWNRYTTTMSAMPVETAPLVRLNMVLLFLVAIEPFLFNLMVIRGFGSAIGPAVSEYYSFDIAGMNFILAYFAHILTLEEKNLIPRESIHRFRATRNTLILSSAIFLYSALPAFWTVMFAGIPVRIILWISTFPIIWGSRLLGGRAR